MYGENVLVSTCQQLGVTLGGGWGANGASEWQKAVPACVPPCMKYFLYLSCLVCREWFNGREECVLPSKNTWETEYLTDTCHMDFNGNDSGRF